MIFEKNPNCINFYPKNSINQFSVGDLVYIDFNSVVVEVIKIEKNVMQVLVINEGPILTNKGVSLNKSVKLNPFTEKDLAAFKITNKKQIKHYALSFCNKKEDVIKMRKQVPKGTNIIAKIENQSGFENCKEICQIADSILIDRGDLSKEFDIEDIPIIQKEITKIAKQQKTKIFVATNFRVND